MPIVYFFYIRRRCNKNEKKVILFIYLIIYSYEIFKVSAKVKKKYIFKRITIDNS